LPDYSARAQPSLLPPMVIGLPKPKVNQSWQRLPKPLKKAGLSLAAETGAVPARLRDVHRAA